MDIENIENDIERLVASLNDLNIRYGEDRLDAILATAITGFYSNQNTDDERLSRLLMVLDTGTETNTQNHSVECTIKKAVHEAVFAGKAVEMVPELQYAALMLATSLVKTFTENNQIELAENIKRAFKESSLALATMIESDRPEVLH
ncbi:hypothetical protein [Pasteurella multocida]|uniref:hypothetical protein n=1 Tax=Pasteurella multocida TaxID=747 RepID=UPI002B653FAA|nr:hypothetical protein [Pasteurella multocida]MEB3457368.1 hypothetical protein [Pasteurella multocida]